MLESGLTTSRATLDGGLTLSSRCRTTENCAFFNVGPPAGHCYLMKIQAKEGASKKATLKKKGGWTGGSIVDFNAVGAAGAGAANPTPEPKSEECDHCPKKCWEHMRKWLLATAFGGTLLGLVATAIIIKEFLPEDGDISLVDGTLWSCFTLTSLTEVSALGLMVVLQQHRRRRRRRRRRSSVVGPVRSGPVRVGCGRWFGSVRFVRWSGFGLV